MALTTDQRELLGFLLTEDFVGAIAGRTYSISPRELHTRLISQRTWPELDVIECQCRSFPPKSHW
jgi:hypothetical protein